MYPPFLSVWWPNLVLLVKRRLDLSTGNDLTEYPISLLSGIIRNDVLSGQINVSTSLHFGSASTKYSTENILIWRGSVSGLTSSAMVTFRVPPFSGSKVVVTDTSEPASGESEIPHWGAQVYVVYARKRIYRQELEWCVNWPRGLVVLLVINE